MLRSLVVLSIALAIALPSMAAVTLTESGKSGTTVTVGYNYDGTGARPRAFGLVLQATGGTITSVTPAKTGESTAAAQGYGIFPGTISIATDGTVSSYGTPVEPTALPGGPSQLGTSRVVAALGSLYKGDANKPANNAALFTVVCSTGTTQLTVTPETTNRKGVVGEDATQVSVAPITITFLVPPAPPTGVAATDGTAATTISVSWTASPDATSYDVYKSFTNNSAAATLAGNIAASPYTYTAGTTQTNAEGRTTYFFVKAKNSAGDSAFSTGDAGYVAEAVKSSAPFYTYWVNFGRPNCWAFQRNCRGDINGTRVGTVLTGYRWVTAEDLTIFSGAFNLLEPALQTNVTSGMQGICADNNRTRVGTVLTGYRWVTAEDLTIFSQYFNLLEPAVPVCANTNYNFWKN